jgi:hypothetical protein
VESGQIASLSRWFLAGARFARRREGPGKDELKKVVPVRSSILDTSQILAP